MSDPVTDFFVSYTGKDKAWAEWIAWQLEHAGYRTLIQAWDFKSGGVFPGDMHRALQQSARVLAVLTPDYMDSGFCQPEWQAAFANDPTGEKGLLVCIRVTDFKPDGILRGRTYIDLVGLSESAARDTLLERLKTGRAKPATAPAFPAASAPAPVFPGGSTHLRPSDFGPRHFATAIPHNLPTLQPFFGREPELKKIADALDPDSRTWGALIDGPGGMGKTSLAVRAAYAVSPTDFEKIVFISLKSRELDDDGIRDLSGFLISGLAELLNELARELRCDHIPRASEAERPRLLLDALRGTRTLLLLDNLESLLKPERDTVFTFVKKLPPGCKAILTCRGRIGSGAEELILEKLSEPAALATLAELATHNPLLAQTSEAERLALYTQTGGIALLLRWTAGQIGRGSCRSITGAIAYLRSCPPGNNALEFIFGDLVEHFAPEETSVLCALTYFTLPANVEHVAITGDVSKEAASTALSSLANRSLVVPDAQELAYTLIPMVASFLQNRKPDEMTATKQRLEDHAFALLESYGAENHVDFPILEKAWAIIASALPLFLSGANERVQTVCSRLRSFLNFTGYWDEWLSFSMSAESKAIEAGDFLEAGWRAYNAGYAHYLLGSSGSVLKCATRADGHWSRVGAGPKERAMAIRLEGVAHLMERNYAAATKSFEAAVELLITQQGDSFDLGVALNSLAEAQRGARAFDEAQRSFMEALRQDTIAGNKVGTSLHTGNMADLFLDLADWLGAESWARSALALSSELGRRESIAANNRRLAKALVRQGKAAESLPHAKKAVEIFTRLGSPDLAEAQATFAECQRTLALERLTPGWTHNTTALEGNTLTAAEVAEALRDPSAVFAHRPAEHLAATRAQAAANEILAGFLHIARDWTRDDLFRLHTVLMQGSTVDYHRPVGAWKKEDNFVTLRLDGKTIVNDTYAPAIYVPALMDTWLTEFNRLRRHPGQPLDDHLWIHATFCRIHPFADGNGRMARLLATIPLLRAGLYPVDIAVTAKDEYLESLARWQLACGPPAPGAPLYPQPGLLLPLRTLSEASLPALP